MYVHKFKKKVSTLAVFLVADPGDDDSDHDDDNEGSAVTDGGSKRASRAIYTRCCSLCL